MKSPPTSELNEILKFTASLVGEATIRALVVIGAARLEEEVKSIAAIAVPGSEADHRAHSFRVDLLVSIGLLPADVGLCLKKIARIRNHFAHTSTAVAITDPKIKSDVDALFAKLDDLIQLSALSADFFHKMAAKIPIGSPPPAWIDDDLRRYQTAVIMLLYHLVIVRHNVPSKAPPIPLGQYAFE
jgi:hypothetical protein